MYDINFIKILQDYLKTNYYRAKVISLDDPLNLNRIQINIFGMTDDIPNESLPWCYLQFPAGLTIYPNVSDIIWIFFENNDYLFPHYINTIYNGIDIDNKIGYKMYSDNLNNVNESGSRNNMSYDFKEIEDIDNYRSILRTINKIEKDEDLVMKRTISHYDTITSESTWYKNFQGLETSITADVSDNKGTTVQSLAEGYDKSPFNNNQKIYPWYELKETENNTDINKIYGGWKFLTEDDINKGLGIFPDSNKRFYLKRYKNWVKNRVNNFGSAEGISDVNLFKNNVSKSWNFVAVPPYIYWDPELAKTNFYKDSKGSVIKSQSLDYQSIQSFPFGKMKIKNRKFYKQSSWFSYDGKSSVELDDNDNYERLALIFNYGDAGLEFSRSGLNGFELWTDGAFRIRGRGLGRNGNGGNTRITNLIEAQDSDILIITNKWAAITGQTGTYVGGMGPVNIRSKLNNISLISENGISLNSMNGADAEKGISYAENEGIVSGVPIISGPGGDGMGENCSLQGWFPYLNGKEEEATEYFKSLNSLLLSVKKLCETIKNAGFPYPATNQSVAIFRWAQTALLTISHIGGSNSLNAVNLISAWDGIQFEGSGQKSK